MRIDARIPVRLLAAAEAAARPPAADPLTVLVLADPDAAAAGPGWAAVRRIDPGTRAGPAPHAAGCACCAGRSGLAVLLTALFVQRARGELALFRRVLLVADGGPAGPLDALFRDDPMVAGRYRLEGPGGEN